MKINLEEKFAKIANHWHPYIIGELNENFVKLAKLKEELVWHSHQEEDEMFVVLSGTLMIDFRDGKTISTESGEIWIVPKPITDLIGTLPMRAVRLTKPLYTRTWN